MDVPALRRALLEWYDRVRRDLPWRRTRDPWAVLVSEFMLQQTTVAAATPYYERFMARWPRPADLAAAPLDELLGLWAGLGYYGRARRLHALASVVAEGDGELPGDRAGLTELPGVGAYTSAAVASIAHDEPVAAVDGNVERVLSRLVALDLDLRKAAGRKALAALADELLEPTRPGDWNQAVMELGARVCKPRGPDCTACPLAPHCAARAAGTAERFPVLPPRRPSVAVRRLAAVVRRGDKLLLRLRDAAPNAGFLELPDVQVDAEIDVPTDAPGDGQPAAELSAHLWERHGLRARATVAGKPLRHAITHHRITVEPWTVVLERGRVRAPLAWVDPRDESRPLTTVCRRLLSAAHPDLLPVREESP